MADKPYTDADVELAIRAAAHARYLRRWPGHPERASRYATEMAGDPMYRAEISAALAALAAAGRLASLTPSGGAIPTAWELRAAATGGGPCGTCGEPFYTHVCLSCSRDKQTPGPGCHNCRRTGMDQTPCLPPVQEG